MKKLILLFSVILACCLPGKVSALDIKPEKEYCIMHSYTHMYLTNNKSWAGAVLETYTGAEDQRYKFETVNVEGVDYFRIRQVSSNNYLCKVGRWDIDWLSDPSTLVPVGRGLFKVEEKDGFVLLAFQYKEESGDGEYLGVGVNAANTSVSSDRYAPEEGSRWEIKEYDPAIVNKDALQVVLREVNEFLGNQNVQEGDTPGHYDRSAYAGLVSAKAAAEALVNAENATQAEVTAAVITLQEAFKTCQESLIIVKPEAGREYFIVCDRIAGKGICSLGANASLLGALLENSDLKYKFVERVVEGVTYYQIQSTTTTNYLYRENYNTKWTADLSAVAEENTLFQIVQTGNLNTPKYVFLKNKATNAYLGHDAGTDWWSDVYSDKGLDKAIYWRIAEELPTGPQIKLNVDMTDMAVSPEGLWVTGNFNNWAAPGSDKSCRLTDEDGDNIYSVTISYPVMSTNPLDDSSKEPLTYRFSNGVGSNDREYVFDDCAFGSNRILGVYKDEIELAPVVLNQCGTGEPTTRIKVAAVGDSNTYGMGWRLIPFRDAWPVQLRDMLGDEYQIQNFGIGGVTMTGYHTTDFYQYVKSWKPDIIVINLGTNDALQYQNWNEANFKKAYRDMIQDFKKTIPGVQIYMMTPIILSPYHETAYGILKDKVVPIINDLAKSALLPLIDGYTKTDQLWGADPVQFIADGIHPNDPQHAAVIAQKVYDALSADKPQILPALTEGAYTADKDYVEYRWYFDDILISNATGKEYTITEPGTYRLGVKVSEDSNDFLISDPIVIKKEDITGVESTAADGKVTILSNPVKDALVIMGLHNAETIDVRLFDNTGRLVMQGSQSRMDISSLSPGLYILQVNGKILKVIKD